jgi:hypothetical protein
MKAPTTQILDDWFTSQRGQPHDLVFAGRIFGGRYGESPQYPRDFEFDGRTLSMRFQTTELLSIVEPYGVMLGKQGQLLIRRAKSARFGWHYYGRPPLPENWCEETYLLTNHEVTMRRTGPLSPTEERFELVAVNFVEII